jgi:hypothetical protein
MNQLQNNVQTEFEADGINQKNEKLISEDQKLPIKRGISLTQRDYEVLIFLVEMKFASLDEICFKFYRNCSNEPGEVSNTYVIKRLSQLIEEGFLKSTRAFDATKRLYYPTIKSYLLLLMLFPERKLPRPTKNIDGRTVVHDYYLLILRLKFEILKKSSYWVSDRTIKQTLDAYNELGGGNTPDGIYIDSNNRPVALELEVSVKSKAIYMEKVKRYVEFIRAHQARPEMIKHVHYVVFGEPSFKTLTAYTALYSNYFTIERASSYGLVNGLFR